MALGRLFFSKFGVGLDFVICTPVPPSTWYIQISLEPIPNCAFETKIYFPSGAQLGEVKSLLQSFENCFTAVSPECLIQMFALLSPSARQTIHRPSREHVSLQSNATPTENAF